MSQTMLHRYVRYCRLAITLLVLVVTMMALWTTTALAQGGNPASAPPTALPMIWYLLAAGLALLVPAGFVLLAVATLEPQRAWNTALGGLAAIGLAAFAYWAIGFALQFGGVGLVYPHGELRGLVWEWSPLSSEWGIGWGMAGLSGWFLSGAHVTALSYTLFLSHLPWVMLAAALPVMALRGRAPSTVTLILSVALGGLIFPLASNWVQGGGWLNALGRNLNLGHGFVDMGGAGTVHLVAAGFALAALTVWSERRQRVAPAGEGERLPPAHQPLLTVVGALLILGGTIGWQFANPLQVESIGAIGMMRGAVSVMLAAAGGMLFPLLYTWFVAGASEPTLTARGFAAGVVAGLAVGPFVQPGIAFVVGLLAGATVPFVTHVLDGRMNLHDMTGVTATSGVPAVIGLLLVGVFADGVAGSGWQVTGPGTYLGVTGQGVSGLLVGSGYQPDFPGQLQSQVIGVAALALWGFVSGLIICVPLGLLFHSLLHRHDVEVHPSASGVAARPPVAVGGDPFANVPYRSEARGGEALRPQEALLPPETAKSAEALRAPETMRTEAWRSAEGAWTHAGQPPATTTMRPEGARAPDLTAAPAPAPRTQAAPPAAPSPPPPVSPQPPVREGFWPDEPLDAGAPTSAPASSTGWAPSSQSLVATYEARAAASPRVDAAGAGLSQDAPADPYVALEPTAAPSAASLLDSALDAPAGGVSQDGDVKAQAPDATHAASASHQATSPLLRRRRGAMPPLSGDVHNG